MLLDLPERRRFESGNLLQWLHVRLDLRRGQGKPELLKRLLGSMEQAEVARLMMRIPKGRALRIERKRHMHLPADFRQPHEHPALVICEIEEPIDIDRRLLHALASF